MSTDADMAPATLILEAGVGPLDTGPDPDPHGLGIDMAYYTPGPGLPVSLLLEVLVPSNSPFGVIRGFQRLGDVIQVVV